MKKTGKSGFTLIELITVIAILAILAAVAIPAFRGITARAQETMCQANRRAASLHYLTYLWLEDKPHSEAEFAAFLQEQMGGDELCPVGGNDACSWDTAKEMIVCSVHGDDIYVIDYSDMPLTADSLYSSFSVFLKTYSEALRPRAKYWSWTDNDANDPRKKAVWDAYYAYLGKPGQVSAQAPDISDFKVFFTYDSTANRFTYDVAGVYLKLKNGKQVIRFADGTVVEGEHYRTYLTGAGGTLAPASGG
ncbi:MAG: prepilin-type N-terminal cleavage/methylation domain-containing protein [Eubacteriales bacterium]|nr:prepilin-type N-terminal cleavage/methylation domain-containing protein [Eubacteriales bacterium]